MIILQEDLREKTQIVFNLDKCSVVHLGNKNEFSYENNGGLVTVVMEFNEEEGTWE